MSSRRQFEDTYRRRIYEYVESNGAVEPEKVRQNVLVRPETDSKPARSGPDLEASVVVPSDEFDHHVSMLKRDGYLEERDGKIRVAHTMEADATSVDIEGGEATVRPARQEDITELVRVIETVAAGDTHVVASRLAEELDREGVLLRNNEREDRVFFVARVADDTVGWLHVGGPQFAAMAHTAELTVGLLEAYRGQGIGAALLERGQAWASSQGYLKLYQNLPATNRGAVSFLEAHGWTVEATHERHYRIDDEFVDEVQLAVWLDDE